MEKNNKNLTIVIVIIAIIALISCILISCITAGLYLYTTRGNQSEEVEVLSEPTTKGDITVTNDSESANVENIEPIENLELNSQTITDSQREIIEKAEEIRGLSAKGDFNLVFRTQEQLREQLINDLLENTTEQDFQDENDLMSLLGFIPDGMDLKSFYLDFYSEQIAGFYDTEENRMYLIDGGSVTENSLTLAHEYTHFLQFDHFDLEGKLNYNSDYCEDNAEDCLIIDAVLEGDATLTEIMLSAEPDLELYQETSSDPETSVFDSAPKYYQNYLLFPYQYGYDFVARFYQQGGFDAVNELYNTPPESIEQVMHPEKYLKDKPIEVLFDPFQDVIAESCELIYDNVFNEADLLWFLNSAYDENWRLTDRTAKQAAEGWGGGSFQFARCDGEPIFFAKTVWDTKKDASELYSSLEEYNDKRWTASDRNQYWQGKDGEQIFIEQQDDIVYLMIASESFDPQQLINLVQSGQSL